MVDQRLPIGHRVERPAGRYAAKRAVKLETEFYYADREGYRNRVTTARFEESGRTQTFFSADLEAIAHD